MAELKCIIFNCDHRRGNYCCYTCTKPCGNRCLNGPERCGQVDADANTLKTLKARIAKRKNEERAKERANALHDTGMTAAEVGEMIGYTKETVKKWVKEAQVVVTAR